MKFCLFGVWVTVRFSLVAVLCFWTMLPGHLLPLLFLAILLHEGGHLLYLHLARLPLRSITLSLRGVLIELKPSVLLTEKQTILLNAAGPAANLLSAAVSLLLPFGLQAERFAAVSLALAAVTLFPLPKSDGGELVFALLLAARKKKNPQ